ncbi:hypothetical protein BDQ17DRAFT_1386670 [Cyathus striatus]|nr:hypothetical protein BDQ17DRAFT_1386670 [Cyathus striatus]
MAFENLGWASGWLNDSITQIPIVTVNSPKSVRSPPRSPRLSGLLFALRDVIGDDPEEEEEEEEFDTDNHIGEEGSQSVILDAGNWSSGLPTLVNDNGFPLSSQEYSTDVSPSEDNHMQSVHDNSYSSHSSPHASPRVHPENSGSDSVDDFVVAETEDDTLHSLSQSLSPSSNDENDGRTTPLNSERSLPNVEQEVDAPAYITDPSSHLLSPVEISNLHLGPFLIDNHDYFSNSFDSGYADSYKPPPATIPPRSPARNSTFELLASPFGSPSQRILSPRVGALIGRSPLSPLRQSFHSEEKAEPSAEYDLDSPTDYKTKRRSDNAEDTARICEGTLRLTPVFTPLTEILAPNLALQGDDTDSDEEYEQEQDSMGSTASWDAGDAATTAEAEANSITEPEQTLDFTEAFIEEEDIHVISADNHEDFLDIDQQVAFIPEEAEANSYMTPNTKDVILEEEVVQYITVGGREEEDDVTAQLPYLLSPTAVYDDGDTLNSLYDVYTSSPVYRPSNRSPSLPKHSVFSSPHVLEKKLSSSSSTPSSLLRERVFTPPPNGRSRAGTITADSPNSLVSPLTSLDSQSRGRASPFSVRSSSSPRVPFGFRPPSLALDKRASLISNRTSRNVLPSLQRRGDALIPEEPPERISTLSPPSPADNGSRLRPLRLDIHVIRIYEPQSAPAHSQTWRSAPSHVTRASLLTIHDRRSSHYSEPSCTSYDELVEHDSYDETIRRPLGPPPNSAPLSRSRPTSVVRPPMYAIATPSPTLMFAIASDDVEQVRQVLERGNAGPNDSVGPQSALEFAMTNDQLSHKMDIVKTLLAFGADPTIARKPSSVDEEPKLMKSLIDDMDPATRYYVERADAAHTRKTSALIHRSFFRPLTRVRYELIGQDRALEQLFRVLSMHSRQLAMSPIVVLLSGPSGHGKSLLARKFGSLLDVPTHTVNMTTLRSTHDLWQSYSMSPYETPTTCTLAEFLINNEGKRCVVVLDEIEKAENEQTLFSLLMPWELAGAVLTPIVGMLTNFKHAHDLVFEHHEARERPNELMSREEYVELMGLLRPRVSDKLGASVLSRVTTVLPFVPFTPDERKAICSEALFNLGGELVRDMSPKVVELVIDTALASYIPSEGARSLRAIPY